MGKIPKDLKRWLKDNNHYTEFIRLIKVCGYSVEDLVQKPYSPYEGEYDYSIQRWFGLDNAIKTTRYNGKFINYAAFLEMLGLNWK